MPEAVFKSRYYWRWVWWTVGLVGLAGAAAASIWLFLIVKKQSGQHGGAAPFLAVGGFVAAVSQVLLAWLQLRQGRRAKSVEQLAPHERRERDARDRLRQHLGRRGRLSQMDDPATLALALRVHPAIDLPQPATSTATVTSPTTAGPATGRRHQLPHPSGARPLDRDLPTFVDRDKGSAIRGWLREARDKGGFLVLVGDSSVGKTRLLYEAARRVLGDFAVLAPDLGDGDLVNKIAEGTFPVPKLIVWLDELQRFLDGPYLTPGSAPITSATVRRLLDAPTPVIIVGTLWPIYDEKLRASEPDPVTRRERPRHPNALDILNDRRLHRVSLETFSADERKAASQLASQDPRLAEALASCDYNVTEVLAGAPELMRRYEQATEEQKAVLHAAIDARRVGIQALLSEQLLREAARGYLSTVHPGGTWFPLALDGLTSASRGAAPLIPGPNADYSQVLGFAVADYLLQHLTWRRRSVRLSGVTWQALADHTHNPDDLIRLGDAARSRLLYSDAESTYRRLADAGDGYAADRLTDLLARQGRVREAIEVLRVRAGGQHASVLLTGLLAYKPHADQAIEILRVRADAGDWLAAALLADLLERPGHFVPIRVPLTWRHFSHDPAGLLAEVLAKQGREDELRARADTGDGSAAGLLTELLAKQGRVDELRARADAGGWYAADRLTELLAKQGREDELRAEVDAGTREAAGRLITMLGDQGETASADRMRRFGLNPDGSIADGNPGIQQSRPTAAS